MPARPAESPHSSPRTPTPPALKWLLNERAVILGKISCCQTRQESLRALMAPVEQRLKRLAILLDTSICTQARHQSALDAMDQTMELAYAMVEPGAAGTVKAWAGKYGARGGLKKFISRALQGAFPEPVRTRDVAIMASAHFSLDLLTQREIGRFRQTVKHALRDLAAEGLVEPLHKKVVFTPGVWLWKGGRLPTLEQMAGEEQEVRRHGPDSTSLSHTP